MYAVNLNFSGILKWFQYSEYQNLMMFLHGYNLGDSAIEEHIIRNQEVINRITGIHTAYLYISSSLSRTDAPVPVNEHRISINQIRCGCDVVDEVVEHYNLDRIDLPALIVITKRHGYRLYPFNTIDEFDRLLKPIGIVTSYRQDMTNLARQIETLRGIDSAIDNEICTIKRYSDAKADSRKAMDLIDNSDIVARISNAYSAILKDIKPSGVKQKTINNIFALTKFEESKELVARLVGIGLSEELIPTAEAFFDDLKQVRFDGHFQTQLGKINKQFKIHRISLENYVVTAERNIIQGESLLSKYREQKESAPAEIERLKQKRNDLLSRYAEILNESTWLEDTKSILSEYDDNSSCLLTLLDYAYKKEERINIVLKTLQRYVEENHFDTFISCKSQDYVEAGALYDLLCHIGRKPFLADVSLRAIGADDYGELIRNVIAGCAYMTVYASNTEYIITPYVHSEWRQFLNLLSQGIINGKIFSIVPEGTVARELPPGLSDKQFFFINRYKEEISDYLRDRNNGVNYTTDK